MFLLGNWKDYMDLEENISLPEMFATLEAMHEAEHRRNKFAAALKGIDLDKGSKRASDDPWQKLKNRVFAGGSNIDNDIVGIRGPIAAQKGFGIGQGIDHATSDEVKWWDK